MANVSISVGSKFGSTMQAGIFQDAQCTRDNSAILQFSTTTFISEDNLYDKSLVQIHGKPEDLRALAELIATAADGLKIAQPEAHELPFIHEDQPRNAAVAEPLRSVLNQIGGGF